MGDEDFEHLPVASKHTIDITAFVRADEITPVFYEKAYQPDPDEAGVRPFALLLRVMEQKGLVALGKLALRQKEHLVTLRATVGRVMLETLSYPDKVRPFESIDVSGVQVSDQEIQMAHALVDMLHEPFDPTKYHDEYRNALMEIISTKLEGGEVISTEEQAPATHTVDLMAALRASMEATQARKPEHEAGPAEPAEATPTRAPTDRKAAAK